MVDAAGGPPGVVAYDDQAAAGSHKPTRVRTEFPETWLWSESSTGYQLLSLLNMHVVSRCWHALHRCFCTFMFDCMHSWLIPLLLEFDASHESNKNVG